MRRRLAGWVAAGSVAVALACGESSSTPASPTSPEPGPSAPQTGCAAPPTGLEPLSDLRSGGYRGEPGGLYPGGANTPPPQHLAAGLALARSIGPLDRNGAPNGNGRYGFVSIGMSNTTQEFSVFKPLAEGDPGKDPRLVIVDGAQSGMTGADWANPGCSCWSTLASRLSSANLTPQQATVAWVKLAEARPTRGWPQEAQVLKENTVRVLQLLSSRLPNVRLAYLSSRIYAGYATSPLNPEPYAYESAFSVRWAIEQQLRRDPALNFDSTAGTIQSPWLAWGPYLWADGPRPRSDGLTWECADFQNDGTHPAGSGRRKVADLLHQFVRTDPTAREWFFANP